MEEKERERCNGEVRTTIECTKSWKRWSSITLTSILSFPLFSYSIACPAFSTHNIHAHMTNTCSFTSFHSILHVLTQPIIPTQHIQNHTEWLKRKAKGNGTKTTKVIFHATFFVFHRRHSNFYLILFFSASVIYITLTFEYSFNLMLLTKIALSRLACVCIKKYSSNMNCSLLRSSKDPIHFFPSAFVHCFVVFSSFSSFSFGTIHSTPSSAYFLCGVIYLVFYFISLFRCNEFILYIGNIDEMIGLYMNEFDSICE